MLKWLRGKNKEEAAYADVFDNVTAGLAKVYEEKLWPLEECSWFEECHGSRLTHADFHARPMILLMGQYSVGKSTFIRHLLERDYPGLRIGPEPTTDKFVCVTSGQQDQVIPGNALVADKTRPFTQMSNFGNEFLQRLECVTMPSPILEGVTLIDTPGVLSGEKQRLSRGYDFEGVIKWFSDRSAMIVLLFDAHKLDISDEFKRCIQVLKGNEDKVKIVLNKADRVSTQQLMRVYGALMWNLGKVMLNPEVARVHIGSFWDEPLENDDQRRLFEMEENDLYTAIALLPKNSAIQKLNDLIKRARLAKTHALIIDYCKKEMPSLFGRSAKKKKLISELGDICTKLAKAKGIPIGDFPDLIKLQRRFESLDFKELPKVSSTKLGLVDKMLAEDIQTLLPLIPQDSRNSTNAQLPFLAVNPSPFGVLKDRGTRGEQSFLSEQHMEKPFDPQVYEEEFISLSPKNGKLGGAQVKGVLESSKLSNAVLHKIWQLSDVDGDGYLTLEEYALCKFFVDMRLKGLDLPDETPEHMCPPGTTRPSKERESTNAGEDNISTSEGSKEINKATPRDTSSLYGSSVDKDYSGIEINKV